MGKKVLVVRVLWELLPVFPVIVEWMFLQRPIFVYCKVYLFIYFFYGIGKNVIYHSNAGDIYFFLHSLIGVSVISVVDFLFSFSFFFKES